MASGVGCIRKYLRLIAFFAPILLLVGPGLLPLAAADQPAGQRATTQTPTAAPTQSLAERRQVEVRHCQSAIGMTRKAAEDELFQEAARQAAEMLYGLEIEAESITENFVLVEDSVWTRLAGRVRPVGSPDYTVGPNLGDICISAEFFITEEDWRTYRIRPIYLQREVCKLVSEAENLGVAAENYTKEAALIEALHDYDGRLRPVPHDLLLRLPKEVQFEDTGPKLMGNVAFYCVSKLGMFVLSDDVQRLIEEHSTPANGAGGPTATAEPPRRATPVPPATPTNTQTPTPTPVTVDSAATIEAAVQATLDAQATMARAVDATLTARAPTQTPTPTGTPTPRPTAPTATWTPTRRVGSAAPRPTRTATPFSVISAPMRNLSGMASMRASSTLPSDQWADYRPQLAIDGNPATSWVEAVADDGSGEWIQLDFPDTVSVDHLRIIVGYDKTEATFTANNRVRTALIRFSDGDRFRASFADQQGLQTVALPDSYPRPKDTTSVRIEIESVYQGRRYTDTPIAEIEVWGMAESLPVNQNLTVQAITVASPTPANCRIAVDGGLGGQWTRSEMGCPLGASALVWSAWQPFQSGHMLWRQDTDAAYVFFQGGGWSKLSDRWNDGMAVPNRGSPPPGLQAPVRGFGYIWGTYDSIYQGLGWALDKEKGFCALVQEFESGFLLRSSSVESCWQGLYNHAREGGFGLQTLKAHTDGYWQR